MSGLIYSAFFEMSSDRIRYMAMGNEKIFMQIYLRNDVGPSRHVNM